MQLAVFDCCMFVATNVVSLNQQVTSYLQLLVVQHSGGQGVPGMKQLKSKLHARDSKYAHAVCLLSDPLSAALAA